MELAKKSVLIHEQRWFEFRLVCDDISGYIRLTKYQHSKSGKTRITERNVPIDVALKNRFYSERTGWSNSLTDYPFTGSYISKKYDLEKFLFWEKYIEQIYNNYKTSFIVKD